MGRLFRMWHLRRAGIPACASLTACALSLLFAPNIAVAGPDSSHAGVSFSRDILPVVRQNCAGCHRPGESAPFPLISYDDVKRHAAQIAAVTKSRFMPPWLPDASSGHFKEERRLSDAQIAAIQEWVKQGSLPDNAVAARMEANVSDAGGEWRLGRPDLILNVSKPYSLAGGGPEVFWNFIIPVPVDRTRWVRAVEIHPRNPRVIHHASIILDRS